MARRKCKNVVECDKMTKIFDPAATATSAIQNVSRIPASRADLKRIIATGEGESSHVRVLFEEIDLTTLMRLAIAFEISDAVLVRAYLRAREVHGVYNPDMDEIAREMGISSLPAGVS
jgi:hypothetical protein